MATASFYTFSKRKNSTAQPTSGNTDIDVVLKSGTSLMSPTFLLSYSSRPGFNYVKFEDRYYFIEDIVSVRNNLWEIVCSADPLATWKTVIGSTNDTILYATGGSNDIIDQRIGVTNTPIIDSNAELLTGDFTGFRDDAEGIAIISVTGKGSFGNYLISVTDVPYLLANASLWDFTSITDVATGFQQFLYGSGNQAAQNLKSAIYLPIILSSMSNFDAATQIHLGAYPCTDIGGSPLNGYRVNNPFLSAHCDVNIPWQFSDWRRNTPYTKVFLYLPLIGCVSLPANDIIDVSTLTVLYSINMLGGDVAVQVRKSGTGGRKLLTASANIAMQSPYGSSNISGAKIASSIGVAVGGVAAVAAGIVSGGAATVALGGALASSAGGLLNALGGETAGGGGLTGSAVTGLDKAVVCTTVSHDLTDTQANLDPIIGKPVMAKHTIATYSGFVQTDGMSVAGDMTDTERDIINSTFDRGAYYE